MKQDDPRKEPLLNADASDTLPRVFLQCASRHHAKVALMEKRDGRYQGITYGGLLEDTRAFASALIEKGVGVRDRIAIFLKNSPAWAISDFGTMFAGGATVPIYETLVPSVIRHILRDSGAVGIVVEDKKQFEKIQSIWPELPTLRFAVLRKPEGVSLPLPDGRIVSLENFLEKGRSLLPKDRPVIDQRMGEIQKDDIASIVYTSGTTGDPKGVMLTHRNFLSNVQGVSSIADITSKDTLLSILPLSHVLERTAGYYIPILAGATIAYAEGMDAVAANLQEVRPTVCCAVPRLFEKIYTRMLKKIEESHPFKKWLFRWALSVGRRPSSRLSRALADAFVCKKIRRTLGGRLRFFVSGGAALSKEIIEFFRSLNVLIYEGYGLTESSPVVSFNFGKNFRPGTVGKVLPEVRVKFSPEGEILVKGPNVMKGYYNNPKATAESIDADGWLHTGDVGVFDEDNFLKITDRIKELIVMSNGKNVAPLPIENKLTQAPLVANAMAVGNNRKYIAALLFPSLPELQALAKSLGINSSKFEDLCRDEKIRERFAEIVEGVNKDLSRYEQVKTFELVPHELTVEGGEITPTLKLKRRIVEKKFGDLIEELYRQDKENY